MLKLDSDAVRSVIASELQNEESVVWSGMQNPKRFVRAFFLKALIPAFWTVGAILIAAMTNADFHWTDASRWGRFQWVAAFMASIGPMGMFASALAFKAQLPTIYFVTNRRAVAMSGKGFRCVASYWPDQLNNTIRTEHSDGTGDIQFEVVRQIVGSGEYVVRLHGFYGVKNADQAERHIVSLRQGAVNARGR